MTNSKTKKNKSVTGNKWLLIFVLSIILLNASIFITFYIKKSTNVSKQFSVPFKVEYRSDSILPVKTKFSFKLNKLRGDNFHLQTSGAVLEQKQLKREDSILWVDYKIPGYHFANLFVDNRRVASIPVHIQTNAWTALLTKKEIENNIAVSFSNVKNLNNFFTDSLDFNQSKIIDSSSFRLHLVNSQKFENVNGDDFLFNLRFRNRSRFEGDCQQICIRLVCEKAEYLIPISEPDCSGENLLALNKPGTNSPIKIGSTDFFNWQSLKLSVKRSELSIFLDENLIANELVDSGAGSLMSVEIISNFIPEIDRITLVSSSSTIKL